MIRLLFIALALFTLEAQAQQLVAFTPRGSVEDFRTNLVAEYTFDDVTGSTVNDGVGSNNGTMSNGAATGTGHNGDGLVLADGVDDLFTIPSATTFDADPMTITFWVYSDGSWGSDDSSGGAGKGSAGIFGRSTANDGTDGYTVLMLTDGSVRYTAKATGGTDTKVTITATAGLSTWYHVAIVYRKGNAENNIIYINGVSGASDTNNNSWSHDGQSTLFSDMNFEFYEEWVGTIDELRFYDAALTQAQIEQVCQFQGGC